MVIFWASPGSIQYIPLLWYLKLFMVVTYSIIIMDTPHTLLHNPYATWNFLHYRHLLETIHWKSWHLLNNRYIFLCRACKLFRLWLTIDLCLVDPHMYTFLRGNLKFIWQNVREQDADSFKNVQTGVRPFVFLIVLIPEDNLTNWPLSSNSIHIFFLEQIFLYTVMVFHQESVLL